MELTPLAVKLLPKLTNTGTMESIQGVYPLDCLTVGARHFDLENGISYDLSFTNTGEAILLMGTAQADLLSSCDRCLEVATTQITGSVEGYFLLDQAGQELPDASDAEFEYISQDGDADIAPALVAAIVIELPAVVLCKPDCKGLCPTCGINLNQADCNCADSSQPLQTDDSSFDPDSPFSVLKDLL